MIKLALSKKYIDISGRYQITLTEEELSKFSRRLHLFWTAASSPQHGREVVNALLS